MNIEFLHSEIIGALRPLHLPANFSDAPVVVQFDAGIFSIEKFMDEPGRSAVGVLISDRDWTHLLNTDEAFLLQRPVKTMRYARCWIFRDWPRDKLEPWLDQLQNVGAVIDPDVRDNQGIVTLCVDAHRGDQVRESWTRTLVDEAWRCASMGLLTEALDLVKAVWQMDLHRSQESTLFYCALLEKQHHMTDARDLLRLEANTTGRSLAELESILQTYVKKIDYRIALTEKPSNTSQRPQKTKGKFFKGNRSPDFSF